ncbi:proline-serine-threonine phosphatase-interacting protein 1b [Notolabrus celidotus]|uniref:proline-serine-threonine phosphatase-interacting protein 1b n=1 Tax=Notolabrus celidotus TaxID=1203425 RepID=UPI00149062A7|nr:proline-serine-threonine phosphatase-interacting protein 1b [Notolabrus celidotus]
MAPLMFKDAFWESEFTCHAGYEAVIQRLRDGRQMCKDVEELLKMRALAEEKYGKELVTIARKAGGHTEISTLRESFEQLKTQIENIGNFHIQLSDVLKEEVKKIETFRERQKEQRKKFQSIMDKVQRKKVSMYKKTMESKKNYELRCKEADEAEEGAEKTNASKTKTRHVASCAITTSQVRHRARQHRQTANEAEKLYSNNILQLESIRQDWEETHIGTCEVFQQLEGDRISMLRCALWDHSNHFSMQCVKNDELYEEVRKILEKCNIMIDNNCFIGMKGTGSRPPEPIVFESYYRRDTSRDNNGDAHFTGGGRDHMIRRSSEGGRLTSSVNISMSSLQSFHSEVTSSGEMSAGSSDDGYAPLPCLQRAASLAAVPAVEDSYFVLYEYSAREGDEMSVSRWDLVRVLEQGEDGWWMVERHGQIGLVPGNYLGKM